MNASPLLSDDEPVSLPSQRTMRGGDLDTLGRIDHYDLLRKLGGGGFGVVYLARDTVSGVEVAIKTLHPLLKRNAEEMDLLREKFRLVHGLTHPNIAKALVIHLVREINVWDDDARAELKLSPGDSVMVMDYAPGVTLSKWRRQFPDGIVPPDLALEVGRQVAEALDYAHSERIVHRDVKPGNIMVETVMPPSAASQVAGHRSQDGLETCDLGPETRIRVRILDFGLAAEIRSSMSRVSTESGDTSGTRPYMAPEQWLGKKQDGRTDQYALACVLYELLSGAPPFAGVYETGDPMIVERAVLARTPDLIEGMPGAVNLALQRALSKSPTERFESCSAFLTAFLHQPDSATPSRPAGAVPFSPPRAVIPPKQSGKEGAPDSALPSRPPEIVPRRDGGVWPWIAAGFAMLSVVLVMTGISRRETQRASDRMAAELEIQSVREEARQQIALAKKSAENEIEQKQRDLATAERARSLAEKKEQEIREESERTATSLKQERTAKSAAEARASTAELLQQNAKRETESVRKELDRVQAELQTSRESKVVVDDLLRAEKSAKEKAEAESREAKAEVERLRGQLAEARSANASAPGSRSPRTTTDPKVPMFDELRNDISSAPAGDAVLAASGNRKSDGEHTETVAGVPWTFVVRNGTARLGGENYGTPAVPKETTGRLVIPSWLGGVPVTDIGFGAFHGCDSITGISVPEGLSRGVFGIEGKSLEEISLPSDYASFHNFVPFGNCPSLRTIRVAPGNRSFVFENGMLLSFDRKTVVRVCPGAVSQVASVPAGTTEIGRGAFSGCDRMASLVLPDSVEKIGSIAFNGCSGLTTMVLPRRLAVLEGNPFGNCSNLASLQVPLGNTAFSIKNGLLFDNAGTLVVCPGGRSGAVEVPHGTKSIGDSAFIGCRKVSSITLPSSLETVGRSAFGFLFLQTLPLPSGLRTVGELAFSSNHNLTTLSIPDSVQSIGRNAFSYCSNLSELSLPGRFRGQESELGIPSTCRVSYR